jgi:hypothetical protein
VASYFCSCITATDPADTNALRELARHGAARLIDELEA